MIPGMTVLAPQDPNEIKAAVRAMIEHDGPVYMRIGNSKIANILPEKEFVIGMPTVYPVDQEIVVESAGKTGVILVVEEHYAEGGLGTLVSEVCSSLHDVTVYRLGIPAEYATTGSYTDLLHYCRLDSEGIANEVKTTLMSFVPSWDEAHKCCFIASNFILKVSETSGPAEIVAFSVWIDYNRVLIAMYGKMEELV